MSGELMLVGSIPLDTPQEVFQTFGAPLGKYLFAMPDGEIGPRRHWISRVHYQVLAAHRDLIRGGQWRTEYSVICVSLVIGSAAP